MTSKWEMVRLGDVADRRVEKVVLDPNVNERLMGVRWKNLGAYERGQTGTTPTKAKTMFRMREGDFVFNKIDTDKGAFSVVGPEMHMSVASNEFPAYVFNPELLSPDFLWLHFQQETVLRELKPAGSEGRARWKEADFESHCVAIPSLAEQRRIVDLIGSLDEAIEIADEGSFVATSIASRLRESLFAAASASERWIISDLISKHRIPVEVSPSAEYTQIGIRAHGRGTFIKAPVSGEALGRKKVFHMTPGCLAFSVVFSWEGATALLGEDCEGKIASHRFPNYKGAFPFSAELLSEFFKTAQGRQLLVDCSPGGAGRNKTLNQTALLASTVNLPLQSEWEQCLERLAASHALAESAAAFAASLRKLRGELLTSLLSGAHTIPESYDEVMTVAEGLVTV